mmetsp:Transcript_26001/g.46014  ORF Transcript_26001/g.46014 Transcript_26001/m.46014 type:complete len:260 (-) Transcript_26001:4253-5032(-)
MADLAEDLPLLPSSNNLHLVRGNAENTVRQALSTSFVLYSVSVAVTCTKLIAMIAVLCFDRSNTSKPLALWVQGCIVLDLLQLSLQIGRLPYIKQMQRGEFPQEPCFISNFVKLTAIMYIGWQIPGNIWYWRCHSCHEEAEALTVLTFVLLILGYLTMAFPALLIASVCACLPVLIVAMMFLKSPTNSASEAVIAEIKPQEYDPKKHKGDCCSICTAEYVEKDPVVALKCDERHLFHEDCVKKWLQINAKCPICRAAIS